MTFLFFLDVVVELSLERKLYAKEMGASCNEEDDDVVVLVVANDEVVIVVVDTLVLVIDNDTPSFNSPS